MNWRQNGGALNGDWLHNFARLACVLHGAWKVRGMDWSTEALLALILRDLDDTTFCMGFLLFFTVYALVAV